MTVTTWEVNPDVIGGLNDGTSPANAYLSVLDGLIARATAIALGDVVDFNCLGASVDATGGLINLESLGWSGAGTLRFTSDLTTGATRETGKYTLQISNVDPFRIENGPENIELVDFQYETTNSGQGTPFLSKITANPGVDTSPKVAITNSFLIVSGASKSQAIYEIEGNAGGNVPELVLDGMTCDGPLDAIMFANFSSNITFTCGSSTITSIDRFYAYGNGNSFTGSSNATDSVFNVTGTWDSRSRCTLDFCATTPASGSRGTNSVDIGVFDDLFANAAIGDFTVPGSDSALVGTGSTGNNVGSDVSAPPPDVTAPNFTTQPFPTSISDVSFTCNFTTDESGDYRVVTVADGDPAPTVDEVLAGQESGGGAPIADSGLFSMTLNVAVAQGVVGLTATTAYDTYVAVVDSSDNKRLGNTLDVTTQALPDTTAPNFVAPLEVTDQTQVTVEITFESDEDGFYRVVALENNATTPTADEVLNGFGAGDSDPVFAGVFNTLSVQTPPSELITGLEAGTNYDVYAALQDAIGNSRLSPLLGIITLALGNVPPSISSTPQTTVTAGVLFTYNVTASDQDGDPVTLSAPTLPPSGWLTFNPGTGVLTGTAADTDAGNNSVVIRASDLTTFSEQAFTISVQIPTAQSDTNNGAHDTRSVSATMIDTSLNVTKLDGEIVEGVIVGDFTESEIPIINPGGSAPRYQDLWNSYTDNGATQGEETYSFIDDVSNPLTGRTFRVIFDENRPYPEIYPYESPNGWKFIKEVIKSGTWETNKFNRLRLWFRVPAGFTAASPGQHNIHFGTYVHGLTGSFLSAEAGGGNHYYHYGDAPITGGIIQWIIDWHPNHRRGADPNIEWVASEGENIEFPTGEEGHNYFDAMTRFYNQLKPEGFQFPSYPAQMDWLGVEVYKEDRPENVDKIYSIMSEYDIDGVSNLLQVRWQRNKADDVTIHEVRYSFTDIWLGGWDAATAAPDGLVSPPDGGAYNTMLYSSAAINMGSNDKIYIAIKRQGDGNHLMRQIIVPITNAGFPQLGGNT
jgi:hypothetical protein